jgi:hypothetical protein
MQHDIAAPETVMRMSPKFQIPTEEERRRRVHSNPVVEMYARTLHLRSAIKCGQVTDKKTILEAATGLDSELEAWRENLGSSWNYAVVQADDAIVDVCFNGLCHVYSNLWIAHIWNNWRSLRILVNETIVETDHGSEMPSAQVAASILLIQELSTEICISVGNFLGTPRK